MGDMIRNALRRKLAAAEAAGDEDRVALIRLRLNAGPEVESPAEVVAESPAEVVAEPPAAEETATRRRRKPRDFAEEFDAEPVATNEDRDD